MAFIFSSFFLLLLFLLFVLLQSFFHPFIIVLAGWVWMIEFKIFIFIRILTVLGFIFEYLVLYRLNSYSQYLYFSLLVPFFFFFFLNLVYYTLRVFYLLLYTSLGPTCKARTTLFVRKLICNFFWEKVQSYVLKFKITS